MRDLNELNMNEGGRRVTRRPPTEAQIREFQSEFGVVLPKEYVDLLNHSNGGHPELDAYRPKGLIEDVLFGVSHFYPLTSDQNDAGGLWTATRAWRRAIPGKVIAIGDNGGGDQLLLSFDQDPPSVELCIHDEGFRLIHVADSFSEFIDMLTMDPDMI